MELAKEWIAVISAVFGIIASALPLGIYLHRTIKSAKINWLMILEQVNWAKVLEKLPMLIQEAEKFINFTGDQKKNWVLEGLRKLCQEHNIMCDTARFETEISKLVAFTKTVNV